VPLGVFLSGGLDSSIVTALLSDIADEPVQTYSVGFDEASYDELDHARTVADAFGTDHHEYTVTPDAAEVLPTLVASTRCHSATPRRCRRTTSHRPRART
jgi:asparagine synthase (glutamine-hydrolysing)